MVRCTATLSSRACSQTSSAATRYSPSASSSVRPTAPKSTPRPGTTFMPDSRSANVLSPRARAAAMACSFVSPAGSWRPITPLNNRSVAWPRMRGPITPIAMPPTPSRITVAVSPRCGVSRLTSRIAEPLKSRDRSRRRLHDAADRARHRPAVIGRPPDSGAERLRVGELGVGRAVGQQRLVRSDAHHLAVVDDDDLVGLRDRRNTLRHNDNRRVGRRLRAARRGPARRCARRARRTRRRTGRSAGRRITARAIASRCRCPPEKLMPPWATRIARPSAWARHEVVGRRHPQRVPHLVVGRVGLAVAQVVGDRAGEQVTALRHQPDRRPQLLGVVVANVDAVDAHRRRRSRRRAGRSTTPASTCPNPSTRRWRWWCRAARSAKHPAAQGGRRRDS